MSRILTPGLRVEADARIRKVRELPIKGKILKRVGETVAASDIVAEAEMQGEIRILRIPEKLGLHPSEVLESLLIKQGDVIRTGQLLFEHRGFFGLFVSKYESPCAGVVELVSSTGHVGVRLAPETLSLDAYIGGKIVEVREGSSITIETSAAFIQGIFGVGGERHGTLRKLAVAAAESVRPDHIPSDCKNQILYGGMSPNSEALKLAAERGAVGFVTGSIDDRALAGYLGFDIGIAMTGDEQVAMSLVVTEGFGNLPMSSRALKVLDALQGREASLNGATQVRAGALRPEIIVSHAETNSLDLHPESSLEVGRKVRLIRVPYFGLIATVTELPHAPEKIETGSLARVLRAQLEDGKMVTVPRANVELI